MYIFQISAKRGRTRYNNTFYYVIRRILLFYQVLDNFDNFVGISLIDLSTGQ